ncbi:MAG: sodium:calcium antiporter [Deltaproteobacteria bacterium]|nr:sodium:calcium antiporter [Deltaproteobacteria bacterium]
MILFSWLFFLLAAALVFHAGRQLTIRGEELAEQTGLARAFVGVILLGLITSLPELVSTLGASALVGEPNLALGNIFGSNACNLAILAFLEIVTVTGTLAHTLDRDNLLTAFLSLIMVSLASMAVIIRGRWHLGFVDLFTPAIAGCYLVGMAMLYRFQKLQTPPGESGGEAPPPPADPEKLARLKKEIFRLAALIVVAALVLSYTADQIAEATGWGSTFVGNFMLAIATSLPEMAVTYSAIRIGSFPMAAGNIFGSNIFNIAILAVTDLGFFSGSLYRQAQHGQLMIAMVGILLASVYLFSTFYGVKRRLLSIRMDSLTVLTIYLLSMYALFHLR